MNGFHICYVHWPEGASLFPSQPYCMGPGGLSPPTNILFVFILAEFVYSKYSLADRCDIFLACINQGQNRILT